MALKIPLKIPPLKRPSLAMPRIKLPFGKKPPSEEGEEAASAFDPDDTSYLEPSKFQQRLPWIGVAAGYAVTLLIIGGVIGYIVIAEDEIVAEMAQQRPRAEVSGEEIVIRRNEPAEAETAAEGEPSAEPSSGDTATQVVRATDAPSAPVAEAEQGSDSFADLLHPHPDPGLIDTSGVGPLPVIGRTAANRGRSTAVPITRSRSGRASRW